MGIGKHGPVTPDEARAIAPGGLIWLRARLADGTFDCAYSLADGGRMIVANAASEEALRELLAAAPDVERNWVITALVPSTETIERHIAHMTEEGTSPLRP